MIDESARSRLIRRFGDDVTGWIDALPDLLSTLTARWNLTVVKLMPGGTGTTFLCTTGPGADAVLKITPDRDIAVHEAKALTSSAHTDAMVDLLDTDLTRGALLLEAINPGTPATDPARVVPHLHDAEPTGFPPLKARVDFLFETVLTRRTGTYYATEHHRARKLADDNVEPVLLHGDMHPGNVLQGPHGPKAIDPRACIGDPAVDWMDFVHGNYDLHGADVDLDRVHEWLTAFKPFYG
ncbi:aminoglycoside phosphotransferase family protein [Lentzea sp. BCCO 10_0856]|uniref:Aminoglycoside phosphotransferase family protein n=1 Tax=Lentzea miocenica TaxID=3095431 RepID=A0ABU4SX40_9PSEU|nr:aminoglycoside phosphotransferase family protein [Lentzea sp. BCCO 10_0856]MDX8030484.1 aminoglycoside phosphotransferase family protein [Lentzea sp. BCCO 10_0856]